jgi:plastocyanin
MKMKELVIIAAAVTALIAVTSATAYANGFASQAYRYSQDTHIGQSGYGPGDMMGVGLMGGGMMGGYGNQYRGDASSQDTPSPYGYGMMGGGMMGGYGGVGGSSDGWNMPCQTGWGYDANVTASGYAEVIIGNYAFHPQTLTVEVGTTVTWINMDFVGHNVEAGTHDEEAEEDRGEVLFESPLLGHMGSFSLTFTEPGEYVFHCDPHPEMEGRIIVVE